MQNESFYGATKTNAGNAGNAGRSYDDVAMTGPGAFDWRDLVKTVAATADAELHREVMRLHALGRTADDIGTFLGVNPAIVHALIFGTDAAERTV